MGYRVYLGRISKHDRKQFMHLKDVDSAYDFWNKRNDSPYMPTGYQELMELGKYVEYAYDSFELEEFYNYDLSEEQFVIAPKKLLQLLIEQYRASTESFYISLNKTLLDGGTKQVQHHIQNKINEWDNVHYNHLNTSTDDPNWHQDGRLTKCWKFEYAVFNLLHILHTFDWDNDYLIYSGH